MASERFAFRSTRDWTLRVARLAIFAIPLVSVVPTLLTTGCGDAKEEKDAVAAALPPQPSMVPGPKGEPLAPGDKSPPLKAAGWTIEKLVSDVDNRPASVILRKR